MEKAKALGFNKLALILLLTSYLTVGNLLNFPQPQFSHLYPGDNCFYFMDFSFI